MSDYMGQLRQSYSPIEIILAATEERDEGRLLRLQSLLEVVYQFRVLKPFLDLSATLAKEGRLKFVVKVKSNFEIDHGNCRTIEDKTISGVLNRFKTSKKYVITLKKISADVLIHEIGHMVEKELGLNLESDFAKIIRADFDLHEINRAISTAVREVMIEQVKAYPKDQVLGEIFTRFFELLAKSKEISGFAPTYGYTIEEFLKAFPNTARYLEHYLFPKMKLITDSCIANYSEQYVKEVNKIQHQWTKGAVDSKHPEPSKPKWSKVVKSIKD